MNGKIQAAKATRRNVKKRMWSLAVVGICGFAMLFTGAYNGLALMEKPVFASGTAVEGIDLDGLSYDEGRSQVLKAETELLEGIEATVSYNGATQVFTAAELGVTTDANEIVAEAYNRDKSENVFADFDAGKQPQRYSLKLSVDDAAIKESVGSFLRRNNERAQDACAEFNPDARTFQYTGDSRGMEANTDEACARIRERLLSGEASIDMAVTGNAVFSPVTTDRLKENTVLIGRCSTKTTANKNRDNNILLMCEAVNGLVLMPGDTISLNSLVGERTEEKGFLPAPAITDGKDLTDEVGGGICQLAGTLYNAALKANMEIVERVHHSWPSDYLPVGLDATLNWDNKDLKVKNTTEWPMYFSARFEEQIVDVAIYGQPCGYEIEIESEILEEYPEPKPQVIYTDELAVGEEQVKVNGRKGYVAEVTRNYLEDGKIVYSEAISKDTFHEIQGVVVRGADGQNK